MYGVTASDNDAASWPFRESRAVSGFDLYNPVGEFEYCMPLHRQNRLEPTNLSRTLLSVDGKRQLLK